MTDELGLVVAIAVRGRLSGCQDEEAEEVVGWKMGKRFLSDEFLKGTLQMELPAVCLLPLLLPPHHLRHQTVQTRI